MSFGDFTVDRNSVKRVLHSDGYLKTYAVDEPAFEFKDDGSYRGVLIEPSATNVALQSEDITVFPWIADNATPDSNATVAPDGTNTADRLIDDNGGGTGNIQVYQVFTTLTGEQTYTASAFIKADQLSWVQLRAEDYDATNDGAAFFDLSGSGAVGSKSGLDASTIEKYPNGWYRCSITWTQGTGDTTALFVIRVADANNSTIVDRDGTSSIFVWGAQLEGGPIATSYIKTTNEALGVTRNADSITMTGASSLIGQTEGTLFVEVDWRATSGKSQILLEASGAPLNNRIFIYNVSLGELRMRAEANNVTVTDQGESSTGFSGGQKIAFAYAENDFVLYRNGSSVSSDTSGSLAALATLTDVDLGQSVTSTFQANMWVKSVALFTRRLTNTELAALTS